VATNGMSMARRDAPWANAGLVVAVRPEDFPEAGPLGGLALQRACERAAFAAGGGGHVAPAQRVSDFLAGRVSSTLPRSTFRPRVASADVAACLAAAVAAALRVALPGFGRKLRGFVTEEAIVVGVETRTSAPLRILRDAETLESPSHPGLYPAGEGAGWAGGIVSAAIDGLRVAERVRR
jgi:uncharacterized FAD-dependent dehydrogenase